MGYFVANARPCTFQLRFSGPGRIRFSSFNGPGRAPINLSAFPISAAFASLIKDILVGAPNTSGTKIFNPVCVAYFLSGKSAYDPRTDDTAYISRELDLINRESTEGWSPDQSAGF
jgi:uncharacterized protein (UPF0297 family)